MNERDGIEVTSHLAPMGGRGEFTPRANQTPKFDPIRVGKIADVDPRARTTQPNLQTYGSKNKMGSQCLILSVQGSEAQPDAPNKHAMHVIYPAGPS